MAKNIRLLEDLVDRAIDRLKALSAEREGLRRETEGLRRDLAQAGATGAPAEMGATAWKAEREQVVAVLRETLRELRGE